MTTQQVASPGRNPIRSEVPAPELPTAGRRSEASLPATADVGNGTPARLFATLLTTVFRWAYRLTGWRLSDEALSRIGRRFSALHCFPVRMRDGRRLYLDLRNPVSVPYLLDGEFPAERMETLLVRELVRPGDVTLDIGANIGWYTSLLCQCAGDGGAVHAFEPNPHLAHLLEALARGHRRLTVHAVALDEEEGHADFYIPGNWISGSRMPGDGDADRCRVRVARLDRSLVGAAPDFVKLDAEGSEMRVLRGAGRILDDAAAPIWMVELSTEEARHFDHDVADVVDTFRSAKRAEYTAYRIGPRRKRLHPLELPASGDFWINALFVPAARRDRISDRWLGEA